MKLDNQYHHKHNKLIKIKLSNYKTRYVKKIL